MSQTIASLLAQQYRTTHQRILKLVSGLTDRQLAWHPSPTSPPLGFHLWHVARYADYLQNVISGGKGHIWERDGLARRWGWSGALGFAGTGTEMADDIATNLPLPAKEVVLDYVGRAFAAAEEAVESLDDVKLMQGHKDPHRPDAQETLWAVRVMNSLTHENRHLGMMECLLGVMGTRGTATV